MNYQILVSPTWVDAENLEDAEQQFLSMLENGAVEYQILPEGE